MDPNPELDQHQNLITSRASAYQVWSTFINAFMSRVTTCLENLEMSVNLTAVREMSGILVKIREMSGKCPRKNLVREKLPKTVYCKLHICIHTGIYSTSMGMIWVTLNMPSAVEECREPSGKCRGISHRLESDHSEWVILWTDGHIDTHTCVIAIFALPLYRGTQVMVGCVVVWCSGLWPTNFPCLALDLPLTGDHLCG